MRKIFFTITFIVFCLLTIYLGINLAMWTLIRFTEPLPVEASKSAVLIEKPALSAQNAPDNNFKTNNVSERYLQPTFNPQEDN